MNIDIPIDPGKKLAVKVGDKVDFSSPLYKSTEKTQERIEVAELLSIHPKTIFHHLKKNVGDTIATGDLLAEKKSFFSDKRVTSHIEGMIIEVDHIEGVVLIETQKETRPEYCWFAGHITEVSKKQIQVKIGKHSVIEAKYVERDFGGMVWLITKETHTNPEHPVGVAERATEYEVSKLEALGGHGLITTYKYEGNTILPRAEFKLKESFSKVESGEFSCCFAQAHNSTIILYSV